MPKFIYTIELNSKVPQNAEEMRSSLESFLDKLTAVCKKNYKISPEESYLKIVSIFDEKGIIIPTHKDQLRSFINGIDI